MPTPFRSALHTTLGAAALLLAAATVLIAVAPSTTRTSRAAAEKPGAGPSDGIAAGRPRPPLMPAAPSSPGRRSDTPGRRVASTNASIPVRPAAQSRIAAPDPPPEVFIERTPAAQATPEPVVRLQPIVESPSAPSPPAEDASRVEAQLAGLQRQVEQLAQAQTTRQQADLDRMMQLMQQLQTSTQLQNLEDQVRRLQASPAGPALPSAAPTESPAPEAETPEPVLRVDANENEPERFSLQIQDAEIAQVLEMLGQLSGENILVGAGVAGKVSANLQDVTLDEALRAVLRAQGYVYERDEKFLFVMTATEAQQRKLLSRKIITKIYRPNYISARDLEKLIAPLLTPTIGKVAVTLPAEAGIKLDRESAGGDNQSQPDALLVQDYAEVITEIDGVFAEMDVPPMQVVIESMILSVRLSDDMQFGVNFALLNSTGSGFLVSGDGTALGGSTGFPGVSGTIPIPPVAGSPFTAIPGGLKLGYLSGDMGAFVRALESIADTNLIASPQLRVLNKQKAELIIGSRIGYSTTTINGNTAIQNVNFLDSGTKLLIRPYIAPDGLVRMEVHPERSSATINEETDLPDLETTEVTTNVMVRDGCTVVIGGLIVEETLQQSDRIPVLGSMPLVGSLFGSRVDQNVRSELIVLITPRIVQEPEDAMEGEAAKIEGAQRADYFRDHLAPINRRNLARMYYEAAERNFERGRLDRARLEIIESLRLDKNHLPALRLRDAIEAARADRRRLWRKPPQPLPMAPEWDIVPADPGPALPPPPAPPVEVEVEGPAIRTGSDSASPWRSE